MCYTGSGNFFVARSETDVLKNSILNFVHPTFYKVYRLMFEIQNQTYNTEAELVQIKIDRKLQGCENLTNGANHSSIGDVEVMKDYLNQLKNKILEVEKGLEGIKGDIKKFNIGEEAPNVEYLSSVKDLRGFIDKNVMVLIGLSTISAILFLGDICCASYGWYLRKSNSQHELLDQTNKNLHEISRKINELEMEDRLNRRVEEMLQSIEDRLNRRVEEVLSSIEQWLARVNHNDEDFGTEIQEIRNNMESVEVENVSASKSTEHRR